MGKRKERRLAAMSNAGRRVKLDLFAEPSGDLGGSSVHDEVGGELDPTQSAGLPESPSSSGGFRPFSSKGLCREGMSFGGMLCCLPPSIVNSNRTLFCYLDNIVMTNWMTNQVNQLTRLSKIICHRVPHSEGKSVESNAVEDNSTQTFQQREMERASSPVGALQSLEDVNSREDLGMHSVDTSSEMISAEQVPASGISDARDLGDMSFGWRLVMHEESNRYYYWNIETGETSWEVPDVLAQTVQSTSDYRSTVTEHAETAPVGTHESTSYMGVDLGTSSDALTKNGSTCSDLVHQSKGVDQNGPQMDVFSQQDQDGLVEDKLCRNDVGQSGLPSNTSPVNDAAAVSGYISGALAMDVDKRGKELPNGLMKQCECLLERVKSLKGSLSSYGSSLLPYWTYSETQLKQLEDAINSEIYQLAVSAQMDDDVKVVIDSSCKEREESEENLGHKSEADAPISVRESVSPVSTYDEHITNNETVSGDDLYTQQLASTGSHTRQMESEARSSEELYATDHVKPEFHSGDVDMDVDMEVEDEVPVAFTTLRDTSGSMEFGAVEPLGQKHPPSDYSSFMSGEASSIPPPPEEEWIPPPPPDNEPSLMQVRGLFPMQHCTMSLFPIRMWNLLQSLLTHQNRFHTILFRMDHCLLCLFNIESGVVSYDALALEKMGTADGSIPAAPDVKLNVSAVAVATDTRSVEFPSTSTTIEAPPTTSTESSVTAPSTNAVASSAAILAPLTASKVQSKVLRSKKRTVAAAPSLRSNKKVSSLVDKWKAAKEELKEDEEHERESAYDMLEKKRQREIEEWRAKQIASGEAKDNANFQPLGGDWRERVKRKRAEAAKEASRTSPEASAIENPQQPDLVEFSKGLPPGWQIENESLPYNDGSTREIHL
ncbi:hypothetical protein Tsubulata_023749 [Turnera subulata]|uniref:WW domain-containing protein n=1 Tax=Turnera subulata TaxID=218843 RepID=A0A9Q0FC26_9ROSI|nr:hypothetical protein Tsubulata_023749 [Turnera subulata]